MGTGTHAAGTLTSERSDAALNRLIQQSRFFGDLTEQVLTRGGIRLGMSVLDVGCGSGDVSFLVASLVGPTGRVLGVDRSAEGVAAARRRAAEAGAAEG